MKELENKKELNEMEMAKVAGGDEGGYVIFNPGTPIVQRGEKPHIFKVPWFV